MESIGQFVLHRRRSGKNTEKDPVRSFSVRRWSSGQGNKIGRKVIQRIIKPETRESRGSLDYYSNILLYVALFDCYLFPIKKVTLLEGLSLAKTFHHYVYGISTDVFCVLGAPFP